MTNTAFLRSAALAALVFPAMAQAQSEPSPASDMAKAEARAAATVAQMTADEKTVLTYGYMALPLGPGAKLPADSVLGAGYVAGIARLKIPALKETDASLGVSWVMGLRGDGGATALPSGVAMASTWNPDLLRRGGATIAGEARAKGFNVLLAGGANLMRDPRNGRTFEYLSEDPLLTGTLVGASIAGIQSANIISTIKHFALNGQETGRKFVDVKISESAARESDLLAFQIGIERGQPGSVMCAYNRVHGKQACDSDWLMNKVLKQDWRYKGFVMSDWGAVPGLGAALNGLDQQSGAQLDPKVFFAAPLAEAAKTDPAYARRRDDMNRRILTAIYANGLDTHPVAKGGSIDLAANAGVAEEVARQGIVLLRNRGDVLPLAAGAKRIAVIGGYADTGVLSGAGSAQVQGAGGPAAVVPMGGDGPFAQFVNQQYHRSAPLKAIKARAKDAAISFNDGRYVSAAVADAKKADVAIVFATQWATEGIDQPDLSLPNGQDALIAAVAAANPRTIVVLETGGPVLMPWLDRTAAVVEAWYPGARGGEAITAVLFGDANPSGRLPITFPASLDHLPRPQLDGLGTIETDFSGAGKPGDAISADYDIEGSDVGYRWNARKGHKALFPFGHGLSYTTFAASGLKVSGLSASFTIANTGRRDGATVAQLYLVSRGGEAKQRLAGYRRVSLAAGTSQSVTLAIDPRLLADWKDGGWTLSGDDYGFALGDSAEALGPVVKIRIGARRWRD
ncbi:glycoside hydrolase family 3 protein [Sphingomonas sp. SUN039]|uniref:beta-glucosidase n=1 Tax=Sphingomonas sp. SUN039 TaxID=2937787 RepID=UPI0021647099|nr:glycoside hydrolase family 3 C-terminal domain-containing protein [Sphingomonas sp. SUN039]UVO54922.1 glycoside hydrolase family 3 C-terminal domain-containing protein [Sphingomonas sp. SUN039]